MTLLYHVTPRGNLPSIRLNGLSLKYCRTTTRAIWLCTAQRSLIIGSHVSIRHVTSETYLVVIPCNVPRDWLRRWIRGLWICSKDIPPARLGRPYNYSPYR